MDLEREALQELTALLLMEVVQLGFPQSVTFLHLTHSWYLRYCIVLTNVLRRIMDKGVVMEFAFKSFGEDEHAYEGEENAYSISAASSAVLNTIFSKTYFPSLHPRLYRLMH